MAKTHLRVTLDDLQLLVDALQQRNDHHKADAEARLYKRLDAIARAHRILPAEIGKIGEIGVFDGYRRLFEFVHALAKSHGPVALWNELDEAKFQFEITLRCAVDAGKVRVVAKARSSSDRLMYSAYVLVQEAGADRLCICARPGCGRLFVKRKPNAKFCSERCQMRSYMTGYRAQNTSSRLNSKTRAPRRRRHAKG